MAEALNEKQGHPILAPFPSTEGLWAFLFSVQLQHAEASYAPYPRKLHDPRPHIEVPAQKLTDRVDLVIVTAMRKAGDLGPKILKPRRSLRQPNMASLDAG